MSPEAIIPPPIIRELSRESEKPRGASLLRARPYLLCFPIGVAFSWLGVGHWLLHAVGALPDYRPLLHATLQTQGFMTWMAIGFLFTMIPRRTETTPPTALELGIVTVSALPLALGAWVGSFAWVQVVWLLVAATVLRFVVVRFVSSTARRRPPNAMVWIPVAILAGIVGATMQVAAPALGSTALWQQVGAGLVQQGLFVGLVLGVGSLALPLMTRGQAPADGTPAWSDRLVRTAHLAAAAVLVTSFWVEAAVSLRLAMLLRGTVTLGVLLASAQIWRRPERSGTNARLILLAAWLLPAGYLAAAAWPLHYRAGLHLALIGGFGLLALAISAHVVLAHGGCRDRLFRRSVPLVAMASAAVIAIVARALMEIDPAAMLRWMGIAAAAFLVATLLWVVVIAPSVRGTRSRS